MISSKGVKTAGGRSNKGGRQRDRQLSKIVIQHNMAMASKLHGVGSGLEVVKYGGTIATMTLAECDRHKCRIAVVKTLIWR